MQKHLVVALAAALSVAGLTAAPTISFADREVVVQPGENMQSISRRYYGDENHVWVITRYNHLASPDLIYAGLKLVLPDLSENDTADLAANEQANGFQATAVGAEFDSNGRPAVGARQRFADGREGHPERFSARRMRADDDENGHIVGLWKRAAMATKRSK